MKLVVCAVIASLGALAVLAQGPQESPPAVPVPASAPDTAATWADRLATAMGGKAAYDRIGALRFHLAIEGAGGKVAAERSIAWDRKGERGRIEMKTGRGDVVAVFDLKSDKGVALENGKPVEGADAAAALKYLRKTWRGDVTSLVLPWLVADAKLSVALEPDEPEEAGTEKPRKRLRLAGADGAAIPEGDAFWLVVDAESGLPVRFEQRFKAMKAEQANLRFAFDGWTKLAGVQFSTVRTGIGNPQTIRIAGLEAPEALDPALFEALDEK